MAHGDFQEEELVSNWDRLRLVLEDAPGKLTRQEIVKVWAEVGKPPSDVSMWRWLERAVERGLMCRSGTGHRSQPFRYWLKEKEEKWKTDPTYHLMEEIEKAKDLANQLR